MFVGKKTQLLRPPHCDNFRENRSSTFSNDNELKSHPKLCLEHQPNIMRFPRQISF